MQTKTVTTFTKRELRDWKAYERVRQSGRWNMYFPQARQASGLSEERYAFVMKNYSELKVAVESDSKTAKK